MHAQDIGYYASPRERSYDALGLMRQLSEHTATAFATAQEVLGDETPDSLVNKRYAERTSQESNLVVCFLHLRIMLFHFF